MKPNFPAWLHSRMDSEGPDGELARAISWEDELPAGLTLASYQDRLCPAVPHELVIAAWRTWRVSLPYANLGPFEKAAHPEVNPWGGPPPC